MARRKDPVAAAERAIDALETSLLAEPDYAFEEKRDVVRALLKLSEKNAKPSRRELDVFNRGLEFDLGPVAFLDLGVHTRSVIHDRARALHVFFATGALPEYKRGVLGDTSYFNFKGRALPAGAVVDTLGCFRAELSYAQHSDFSGESELARLYTDAELHQIRRATPVRADQLSPSELRALLRSYGSDDERKHRFAGLRNDWLFLYEDAKALQHKMRARAELNRHLPKAISTIVTDHL